MRPDPENDRRIGDLFRDTEAIRLALRKGVRQALLRHKLLGQSVVVWRDGAVVTLEPDEIEIPDLEPDDRPI